MLPYKVIQKIMKDREIITQFRSVYFNTHLLIEFYKNPTIAWQNEFLSQYFANYSVFKTWNHYQLAAYSFFFENLTRYVHWSEQ